MSTPLIQVKNLTAAYGEEVILKDITFEVFAGEKLVILGASGCGKSTLLRHMVGLNRPIEGQVLIDGLDIQESFEMDRRQGIRKFGILFQSSALLGSMSIGENIALPLLEYTDLPKSAIDNLVRMKLCMVNLGGYEDYLPSELSGGMKKRAGLARALALNPRILFLDEPTSGLDPVTAAEIDDLILSINRNMGTTMVIVTHELTSIFQVARRSIMLDKSTKGIIAQGDPLELKNNPPLPAVKRFFNREPERQAVI